MKQVTVPDFVDYPEFYEISDNLPLFNGVFVYIIDKYEFSGFSLYIGFRDNYSIYRIADFKSNEFSSDLPDGAMAVLSLSDKLKEVMARARISDAIYYFSNSDSGIVLVDMMLSANKFAGPGMLRDLFGNLMPTQSVSEIAVFDDEMAIKHKGKIAKPSRFRYLTENGLIRPQYGVI